MKVPLIGITTYHRNERGYIQLPGQYADAVRRAGGIPLLIQPGEPRLAELMDLLDGLILSGGGDVDPKRYSDDHHAEVYWVDEERDAAEFTLTEAALARNMPLLCICRGFQVLNVALGGTLITHIPAAMPEAIDHRQPPDKPYGPIAHEVEVVADSNLARVMQADRVVTASWHHQGIDKLGEGLRVVAAASDGIVEAVELAGKPVLAVQWHPELTAVSDPTQQKLFDELVRQAGERRG